MFTTIEAVLEEVAIREAELDYEHTFDLDEVMFYGVRVA